MEWAQHGMRELTRQGMAGERHVRRGMCDLAFSVDSENYRSS
jgi:hypothetical protein